LGLCTHANLPCLVDLALSRYSYFNGVCLDKTRHKVARLLLIKVILKQSQKAFYVLYFIYYLPEECLMSAALEMDGWMGGWMDGWVGHRLQKTILKERSFLIFLSYRNENPNWPLLLKQWDIFSVALLI